MNSSKIINASNIMLGNKQVNNLYVGSNKIWSKSNSQSFDILPVVMDSASTLQLSLPSSFITTGNSVFLMKLLSNENIKLSNVDIKYLGCTTDTSTTINKVRIEKIDDYALLCNRLYSFDSWSGGYSNARFSEQTAISLYNNSKTLKFTGFVDENNTTLLRGKYVNRVIKIPACGASGIEKVYMFPYTFYDKYYGMTTFNMYFLDYNDTANSRRNNYLWNNDSQTFIKNGVTKTLDDTLFSSLNINYESLECNIEYSIGPNNTNEFRETVLYGSQVLIHFIQEPHNDHRIYIARDINRGFANKYIEDNDTNLKYLFNLSTSKIINNSIEIYDSIESSTYLSNNGSLTSTGTYILYPVLLENEYDIIYDGNHSISSTTYTWDNIQFKRCILSRNSKIIFHKK